MNTDWYCFRTANKKERFAAECLSREMNVKTFCPRVSTIKNTRRGRVRFTEAIFPCYMFARIDLGEHLIKAERVHGINGIVKYGCRIPSVPASFLEGLRDELKDDVLYVNPPALEERDMVRISRGPFESIVGRLLNVNSAGDRVAILLDLMGTEVRTVVSAYDVEMV